MLPELRTTFLNYGDELNYLNDVVAHFVAVEKTGTPECARYLERMEMLLEQRGPDDGSILLQDHWALFYEAKADFARAAQHRRAELDLVTRLFEIGGPVPPIDEGFRLRVLQALAADYLRCGERDKATALLKSAWTDQA